MYSKLTGIGEDWTECRRNQSFVDRLWQ